MGIRGLTTFVANNAHKYLEKYELRDSYLVIDGNNIASQLYKWHCNRNDCFGGDYDKYARVVYSFFKLLEKCNVVPLVVFDGGYENRKLRTIHSRMRDKVKSIKRLNSVTQSSLSVFPLFMRDLFVEIVLQLGVKAVRCDFEADYEMACLARNLNCPVLSYDSDFYVFDVLYIPFSSFDMNARKVKRSGPPQFFIFCHLYKMENFVKSYGGLNKSNLPLIAILLGNDYIKKSVFRNFYSQIKLPKRRNMNSEQQRKIASVIKWMQNETYDSAVKKILGRLKAQDRKFVAEQIQLITEGYICSNSKLLQYLDITQEEKNRNDDFKYECDPTTVLNDLHECIDQKPEDVVTDAELECCKEEVDDVTDSSDSSSESSESSVQLQKEVSTTEIPEWFLDKYRRCEYPAPFMDILFRSKYFCNPQQEDYSNIYSHSISVTILSAINKILSSGTVESLKYVARGERSGIKNYLTPPCSLELPSLISLKEMTSESAKLTLLKVLDISCDSIVNFVESLPLTWQLYVLGIIYWIKNAQPKVPYSHVYSVVLCMLALNKVDEEVGYFRSTIKFMSKFENKLTAEQEESQSIKSNNFMTLLNAISNKDCLLCCKELIPYYQMDVKMTTYLKLFDIQIVDCFAQLQSCLLHIKYLNMLLNKPFVDFLVCNFYDGTFLFNMSNNLMKRTNVDAYMSILLKCSPSILSCFNAVIQKLIEVMSGNIVATVGKRKRRKKKKTAPSEVNGDLLSENKESSDEELVDVNNRFSLLRVAK